MTRIECEDMECTHNKGGVCDREVIRMGVDYTTYCATYEWVGQQVAQQMRADLAERMRHAR